MDQTKPKILVFSTAYLPLIGGAEIAIKEITDRIGSFEFDLITARLDTGLPARERIGSVNVYRVGNGSWLDKFLLPFTGCKLAKKLHKSNGYKLVWAMMASQAGIAAARFKKQAGLKLLTTLQEGDEEGYLRRYVLGSDLLYKIFIRPWHVLAIRRADHIQAISKYLEKRAKSAGAQAPISVIPNGVDLDKFTESFSAAEKDQARKKLGIKPGEKIVVSFSRLVQKNAMDVLIQAFKYLINDNVRLFIFGWSSKNNEELSHQRLVDDLKLGDKISIQESIANAEVPLYLSIADVFVRPARSEGQGIAFLEAMASGIPVIATPAGGIVDFLEDGKTGLFCQVDNPEDLASKIEQIFTSNQLREEMVKNAKDLVRNHYDWNIIAKRMDSLFNDIAYGK